MPTRKNFPSYKKRRQDSAKERQDIYDAMPFEQKLERAGKKERAKLESRPAKTNQPINGVPDGIPPKDFKLSREIRDKRDKLWQEIQSLKKIKKETPEILTQIKKLESEIDTLLESK